MRIAFFKNILTSRTACLIVSQYFKSWVETAFVLKEEARKHFDCPVLEGMELENQGGMGTELNHWEKRLLEVSAGNYIPLQ